MRTPGKPCIVVSSFAASNLNQLALLSRPIHKTVSFVFITTGKRQTIAHEPAIKTHYACSFRSVNKISSFPDSFFFFAIPSIIIQIEIAPLVDCQVAAYCTAKAATP